MAESDSSITVRVEEMHSHVRIYPPVLPTVNPFEQHAGARRSTQPYISVYFS